MTKMDMIPQAIHSTSTAITARQSLILMARKPAKNVGLDTRAVPFSSLNWDVGTILVEGFDIVQQQLAQTGHTYAIPTFYALDSSGLYSIVAGLEFSVDAGGVLSDANLQAPRETIVLYRGTALMIRFLAGGEIINGVSVANILYGLNGDDSLRGNVGDDIINGGWGINYLNGGEGVDTSTHDYDDAGYALSKNPVYGFVEILVKWGGSFGVVLGDFKKLEFRNTTLKTEELNYVGTFNYLPPDSSSPMRRFYNTATNSFFYSVSSGETSYLIDSSSVKRKILMSCRLFITIAHLRQRIPIQIPLISIGITTPGLKGIFTEDINETAYLNEKIADSQSPFVYEGVAFNVYQWDPNLCANGEEVAVYRLYNPDLDQYLWTADDSEIVLICAYFVNDNAGPQY